jgi:hypothetical protein
MSQPAVSGQARFLRIEAVWMKPGATVCRRLRRSNKSFGITALLYIYNNQTG